MSLGTICRVSEAVLYFSCSFATQPGLLLLEFTVERTPFSEE